MPFILRNGPEQPRTYSFQVHQASTLSQLNPLARALVDGLSGGAISAQEDS